MFVIISANVNHSLLHREQTNHINTWHHKYHCCKYSHSQFFLHISWTMLHNISWNFRLPLDNILCKPMM